MGHGLAEPTGGELAHGPSKDPCQQGPSGHVDRALGPGAGPLRRVQGKLLRPNNPGAGADRGKGGPPDADGPLGSFQLLYTWWAIVLAEVILAAPIAAAMTAAAVQGVDPRVRRTAMTLGAGRWRVNWLVAREARFALSAAVVLAFGRVLAEVGAAMIVGGNIRHHTRTLTTAVALATSQGDFALAIALGLVLLALALTVNVLLQMLHRRDDPLHS